MKRKIPFIALIILAFVAIGKAETCNSILTDAHFERFMFGLDATYGRHKLQKALQLVRNNCLTSLQVKTLAEAFETDRQRLRIAKLSYTNVLDKDNFYDVYDAFDKFSMAFRLHDMIHGLIPDEFGRNKGVNNTESGYGYEPFQFPDLHYPRTDKYDGLYICSDVLDKQGFMRIAERLSEAVSDDNRLTHLNRRSKEVCFTMAQSMKLTFLFDSEVAALAMIKSLYGFGKIYDMENYQAAKAVFQNSYNRMDWVEYAEMVLEETFPPSEIVVCEPTRDRLNDMRSALSKRHFPGDKLDLARLLVKDYCFTVGQIKGLMGLFTFGSYKLELAKITYNSCLDPHNYYLLIDELTFYSEKEELRRYIEEHRVNS
jgi:hypothetical protein